ncbi:hypothetical protein RYH72_002187 [Pseudomonas syringae pv. actinidiae]
MSAQDIVLSPEESAELSRRTRDVIGLYLDPPDKALVLCCDEKSQVQALEVPSRDCLWASAISARNRTITFAMAP